MPLTFGKVPHPPFEDRPIFKSAGFGQDDLGPRQPKFVVLHRMIGGLLGTDAFFRLDTTAALTDYGVGVAAQDGAAAGTIYRWNDPRGRQSGWASGPVNGAYGDGLAVVNKYGIDAVNRDGVSIEVSGAGYGTAVDAKAAEAVAALMAYWWDQMGIPYTAAPINPATGISAVLWHQEFTVGTGKVCPGQVVMDLTPALIERATAIMRQHQEATVPEIPAPGYPAGLDLAIAAKLFGSLKIPDKKEPFKFDPNGPISRLWLQVGKDTGTWPKLTTYLRFDQREYWTFANALVLWRPNAAAPVRVLR